MHESLKQELLELEPQAINPSNCLPNKSLHQQILKNTQKTLKSQAKQFNLGNGQKFKDPFDAADYLLDREYGDSFLFNPDQHDPLFIPPVWKSNQYEKKDPRVAMLDYKIEEQFTKTLENLITESPNDWFTKELKTFILSQNDGLPN